MSTTTNLTKENDAVTSDTTAEAVVPAPSKGTDTEVINVAEEKRKSNEEDGPQNVEEEDEPEDVEDGEPVWDGGMSRAPIARPVSGQRPTRPIGTSHR